MEVVIDRQAADDLAGHFLAISKHVPLRPIRTEVDYDAAVASLNALLDLGDGRVLVPEHVGPEPTVDGGLVRLQDICAQPETGVKEYLVVLVGRVQVMHQADKAVVVEVGQSGLDVTPGRGFLGLACFHLCALPELKAGHMGWAKAE
jgi:hypothetical protein